MLMFVVTSWGESAAMAAVMSYAVFYGGFAQLVAGVLEVSQQSWQGLGSCVTVIVVLWGMQQHH